MNVKLIKYILMLCGYGALSVCVLIFSFIIADNYLFASPTTWANDILYNLGDLYLPAFGMYLHFWGGTIIMILGLIQILPVLRNDRLFILHRLIGTIICIFSIITSIGGNIFIYTVGTVGGMNMDIAFSVAGWLMFLFALMTYIKARCHDKASHKNWALRLWAMIYSSLFYRITYFMLFAFGYSFSTSSDFYRPLDEFLDWWFFVIPLFFMETYIRVSRYLRNKRVERDVLMVAYYDKISEPIITYTSVNATE